MLNRKLNWSKMRFVLFFVPWKKKKLAYYINDQSLTKHFYYNISCIIILSFKIHYCPSWTWTHPSLKLYRTLFSSFCEVLQTNQQTSKQHTQIKAHYFDAEDDYLQLETPMTAAQSSSIVRSLTPAISGSQVVCESSGGQDRRYSHTKTEVSLPLHSGYWVEMCLSNK